MGGRNITKVAIRQHLKSQSCSDVARRTKQPLMNAIPTAKENSLDSKYLKKLIAAEADKRIGKSSLSFFYKVGQNTRLLSKGCNSCI